MTKIFDLIRPGDRVLCAVSGGMDSVYLLDQMRHILPTRGAEVLAAHYNHRLRGEESDRDERFVRALCDKWEISCVVGYGDGSARSEAAARNARYAFLQQTAEELHCAWILTAHTADDQLETMLLNLARGAGLRGLAGIPPRRGKILRPMLDQDRALIARYLEKLELPHVEDSTNEENRYARNRIRHEAVPALRSVNPQAVRHASEAADSLREDEAFLQSLAVEAMRADDAPGVSLSVLRALARPVRARVFRLLFGERLELQHVEALHAFCQEDAPASLDLPGVRARREQGRLFRLSEPVPLPEFALAPGLIRTLPEHGLRVIVTDREQLDEIYDSLTVYRFKSTEIRGKLFFTARKPGDALRLSGRGCTKRLSDLLAEAGVGASERDLVPVIRDDLGAVAALGFVCERLEPQEEDAVLTVLIEKLEKEEKEEKEL